MIDGCIADLACTATVAAGDGPSVAHAGRVLRTELPAALSAALDRALADDPIVYVARSLHCELRAGSAVTGEVLAGSIAAQVVSSVRNPARDGACLVRFASLAEYLAAFLDALVRGDAWHRWYFDPLRRFARPEPAATLLALDAEGHDLAPVLLALHRSGELSRVLTAVGEEALARVWPSARRARPRQEEWLSLVRLALDLARALGWDVPDHQDLRGIAASLAAADADAEAEADLDWTDPAGLAHALARAVRLVSVPPPAGAVVPADQLPRWLEWVDADTLAQHLSVPPRTAPPAAPAGPVAALAGPPTSVARPPRTLAVEAILVRLVACGATVLDDRYPATSSAELWAALVDQAPELAGATWARDAVRRFVTQQLAGPAEASRLRVASVPCAGVYLLLRTLDALRMPALCRHAGVLPGWLLLMLAQRWAGPEVGPDEVAGALRPIAGDIGPGPGSLPTGTWPGLQAEVARVAVAQGRDDPGRPVPPASLAAMEHAHIGDPETDTSLDLVALTVLGHWARWLRGFDGASAPYLLATFLRRPGRLIPVGDGTLRVSLGRLPHDIVLDASGCLAPFELQWPWADQAVRLRRIEFAMET